MKEVWSGQTRPLYFMLALPIFPGRLQPSIVGRSELNFRVRDGNGWTLALINTNFVRAKAAYSAPLLFLSGPNPLRWALSRPGDSSIITKVALGNKLDCNRFAPACQDFISYFS